MAQLSLNNVLCLAGKYNMSAKLNHIVANDGPDILDNTTMGHTARCRKKGLDLITADLEGFWEEEPDTYFSDLGTPNVPMTIAPEPTEGGPAYSFLSQNIEYKWGGMVGDLAKFSVKAESVGTKMIRGYILLNGTKGSSGNGTGFNLGSGAGKTLYGSLHVISASASDTLDVIIQSDSADTWLSPAAKITFAQVALGAGGGGTYEWKTAAGDGDIWYRVNYTIGGAGPSFIFAVFLGII